MRGFGYEIFRPLGSLQLQKCAGALEGDATALHDAATLAHRRPSGAIESVPELYDLGMRRAPLDLELLDLFVGELLRLEFPPGTERAHISEGEIASFSDAALGRFLSEAAVRHTKYLARGDAVWLVARIVRLVEAAIAFELPFLAGNPRQHARLSMALKSPPINTWPGAAQMVGRLHSPTMASGRS